MKENLSVNWFLLKEFFGILIEPMKSEFMNLWLEFEAGETETAILQVL